MNPNSNLEGEIFNKKILKPRIYCAVVTLILKKIQIDHYTDPTSFQLNICNDFDGHSNDIIQILRENLIHCNVFTHLSADNYSFVKHPKKSLIQTSAEKIYHGCWDNITKVTLSEIVLHNYIAKPKCRKEKW